MQSWSFGRSWRVFAEALFDGRMHGKTVVGNNVTAGNHLRAERRKNPGYSRPLQRPDFASRFVQTGVDRFLLGSDEKLF